MFIYDFHMKISQPELSIAAGVNKSDFKLSGLRIFHIVVGLGFNAFGFVFRGHALEIVSMEWGVIPLGAGVFDICFVSALLGGPVSGAKIRGQYK